MRLSNLHIKLLFVLIFIFLGGASVHGEAYVVVDPVKELHPKIRKGQSVQFDSPAGSYQKLYEAKSENEVRCLFYKVPLQGKGGLGLLFFLEGKEKCDLSDKNKYQVLFNKVRDLKVLDIDWKKRFQFKLKFLNNDKEENLSFFIPFPDRENSYWKGIRPVINKKEAQLPLGEDEICHRGCDDSSSLCHLCPNGQWTSFITLGCPGEVSGICGANRCGKRGEKACLRMTTYFQNASCEQIKKFVYCSFGRELECQSNGDLTCR